MALVAAEFTDPNNWSILGWVCIPSLVYVIVVLRRGFNDAAMRVLTDPFLILVAAFALYFLFGALLPVLGSEEQIQFALRWYPTNAEDAVRITGINLIGLAILLFSASFFNCSSIEKMFKPVIGKFRKFPLRMVFWLFSILGVTATLNMLSVDITGNDIVNGSVRILSGLLNMAILVGMIYQGRGEKLLRIIVLPLVITGSVTGFLLLNKAAILTPLLAFMLGFYLRRPSLKILLLFGAILFLCLTFILKPIAEARDFLQDDSNKSVASRLVILGATFLGARFIDNARAGTWSRLCYVSPQHAAVNFYEKGNGGEDFDKLGWVFLPRAFFPDKPIISNSGRDFNKKVTGLDNSSTGMGLFVSGYYNLGWFGLLAVSVFSGWILAIFAAFSRAVIASSSVILLPISQLGNYMAFRIDGHFIVDYLGLFAMIMFPLLVLAFFIQLNRV